MTTSEIVDGYVEQLAGWKRETVGYLRRLIHEAVPEISETWKWDTPVFVAGRNVCAIGVFADHVKVNFFRGALLDDPTGLLNAGLEAKTSRAIDLRDGDAASLDAEAFRQLVRRAAESAA